MRLPVLRAMARTHETDPSLRRVQRDSAIACAVFAAVLAPIFATVFTAIFTTRRFVGFAGEGGLGETECGRQRNAGEQRTR